MSKPSQVVPSKCLNFSGKPTQIDCTNERAILYALGVGFSRDPLDQKDLQYTYEGHEDFQVMPTIGR